MRLFLDRRGCTALAVAASTVPAPLVVATDPWADAVMSYVAGEDANDSYDDPATTVGSPERFTGEGFGYPGVVSGFVPPFGTDEIVSIGRGGALKSSWYGDCLPSRDFPMLIDLYQQGRLDLDGFVSEIIPLDGVEEAFHKMERGEVLRSVVVM